jgi:hypothetical protein
LLIAVSMQPSHVAGLYAGCLLAVSMELLGIATIIGNRWILSSPIIAAVVTYALLLAMGAVPWPDSGGWTAILTGVLAVGAIGGMIFAGISARQLARQTTAAVEASFPYIRLVLESPKAIPRRTTWAGNAAVHAWWGEFKIVGGTSPARQVDVWVRDHENYYFARLGVVLPRERSKFLAIQSPGMVDQCPFPVLVSEDFKDQFRVWLGLVWICPDKSCRYNLYCIQRNAQWQGQEFLPDRLDVGFKCQKVSALPGVQT